MPDARHANLLEPEALVELFLRHPPQGFAAASEADLPVFGTDFDLLTTLEPAILVKIRRFPLFGLWSRLLRFPARFAAPEGLGAGRASGRLPRALCRRAIPADRQGRAGSFPAAGCR